MVVKRSTWLACGAERCIHEVMTPKLLKFVAKPLVAFEPLDPPTFPERWEERKYLVRLKLFGLLPLGTQTIDITTSASREGSFSMRDNGYSRLIPTWDHLIIIHDSQGGSIYTDQVNVKAGVLTPFVWAFAWVFYRHRQRRWRRLVNNSFDYR